MNYTGKDCANQFNIVSDLIKSTKNEKLLYAFYKYDDMMDKVFTTRIDKLDKNISENEIGIKQSYLESKKTRDEIHDARIETYHIAGQTKDEFFKITKELFDKMPSVNKAVLNHPRLSGLLLVIKGHGFVKQLTDIDINKISKGTLPDKTSKESGT